MAQEFTIKSPTIEDKINQLLPSQAGLGAGIDFSASTMVIPIVDLTETAEGSGLRVDLQSALSHSTATAFSVVNTTTDIVTTTGYYRVFGSAQNTNSQTKIILTDGTTAKALFYQVGNAGTTISNNFDFIVLLQAGDTLQAFSNSTGGYISGCTRQIADINGNLTNP